VSPPIGSGRVKRVEGRGEGKKIEILLKEKGGGNSKRKRTKQKWK
jgi:hypothetical protein